MNTRRWSVKSRTSIFFVLLICLLLVLTGCAAKAPSPGQTQPPLAPLEPAPVSVQPPPTPSQPSPAPEPVQPMPPASTTPTPQTPSPKIISATDYLKSISDGLYEMYAKFGLDENVTDYITFVQSLPKDFALYALTNKLCIKDHKLTDLEKQFLKEPDKYLQQMFDSYMAEIGKIDPEMAIQLKKLPYFRMLDTKDVEVVEDFLWLAGIPKYKTMLGKIYGKGIERKMHSVALEALLWRAFNRNYDEYNPLEDLNYSPIFTRLADFQEKYNKQMDETEPVEGKKPQVMGINYLWEPMRWLNKSQEDIRFDYALMRWVLGANAVKIWALVTFNHVKFAHEEGFEVWLEYCPVYLLDRTDPDISVEDYCKQLATFAQEAERLKVKVLIVGHEVDVRLWRFDYKTGALRRAVDKMVKTARQHYNGLVTYCTWDGPWDVCNINWEPMDIIFPQIYKSDTTRELTDREYLNIIKRWKNKKPRKLMAVSEFGSLTVSEGASIGGWNFLLKTKPYNYDPQAQADFIERQLRVLVKTDIYGIFLQCWDEGITPRVGYNKSEVGHGIWDWRSKEPKPSFWVAYKYYRKR